MPASCLTIIVTTFQNCMWHGEKVIRKIFKLPMRTHNYIVCGIVESVNIILDRRIAKYIFNVINSDNTILTSFINSFLNCEFSVFVENYRYIMYKYNIPSILW